MASRAWTLALKRLTTRPSRPARRARLGRDWLLEDRLAPANVVTNPAVRLGPDGRPVPNPAFDEAGRGLPGNKSRIDDALLRLFNAYQDRGPGWAAAEPDDARALQVDAAGRVLVRVMAADVTAVGPALGAIGFETAGARPESHLTEGWLPVPALRPAEGLAAQGLWGVLPVLRPGTAVGATTSQADWVLEADRVRAALPAGYDGTGVRIGVLSDSYNNGNGAAADVASGDLPGDVQVIQDLPGRGSDEGRAMLQLVHDVAPGAGLAFATAFSSETGFADNIRRLADPAQGNAQVIVDDVYYYDEPFYQPGVIGQAVQDVYATRGVAYFTAAGNQADHAWEAVAPATVNTTVAGTSGAFYDFDPGPGTDYLQRVTISPGGSAQIALQWDQPFYTAAGVVSDLDVRLLRADTGEVVASSLSNNLLNHTPFESINYGNNTGQSNFDIAIQLYAGPTVGRLKYEYYGGLSVAEYATNSPTVTPHGGIPEAVAVAAVPYSNQRAREGYTSSGPMTLLFDAAGNRLATPVVPPSPLVAAPDGTNTTFFGGDSDGDGKPNFFGTSAAAPHAAAVAALVRQAYPTLTPAQVYQKLADSADPGTDSPGFDKYTGWGLIDAYRAIFGPAVNGGTAFQDGFDAGGLGPQWETYATGPGRIQVTSANGPVSGSHVILQERLGDTGNAAGAGRTELTLHVNATGGNVLRFSEKEFNDDDHPMPPTFTGSGDYDGVAFSVDGNTWYRLVSLTGAASANTYNSFQFDLGAAATKAGVALTADTRIRFQQFDDENFPNDGIAFDDIAFGANQAPSFTKGPDQTVREDAGAQSVPGWATDISAGPGETAQTVSFEVVSDSNPALFSVAPAVDPGGKLTYMPAPNANGLADVAVRIKDNGGTAGGGVDTSPAQTFRITVAAVNDAPSFTKGADQTVPEDAAAQTVAGWATAISAGPPDEAPQALAFEVTGNTNPGLFAVLPAVDPGGKLTYTPAADANGSATITVRLKDDGGTANGGADASPGQTFTITLTAVNDVPSFIKGADQTVSEDAGARTVAGWAMAISAGPPNESGQTLTFVATTNNDALFSALPAINPTTGTLTYTPAANASGSAAVTVRLKDDGGTANGGVDTSPAQTFTITVNSVNDAPSFATGPDQTVNEDAGPQTVANWATGVSAGPPDEAAQALTFEVTGNTNPGLFAVAPAVAANGTLTYTPAPDANGAATITVRLKDDGGTANGGVNVSPAETFKITVNSVNDVPSFTKGANQAIDEDAGAQTVTGWATGISPGPANESGQVLTFQVTTSNDALFSARPAVGAGGTLTYTPAADANGVATVTVRLRDDGGTANGGVDVSPAQTFTITVNAVNDAPAFTPGADQAVSEDAGAQTVASWATAISPGPADEAGQKLAFEVTGNTNPGLFSAAPAVSPTGTLTYTPAADAFGSATVTVRLKDDGGTANGGSDASPARTFTITVNGVNDAPSFTAGGNRAVNEDAGPQSVAGWAAGMSAGPANEGGQALTFEVVSDTNPGLFSAGPAVNATTGTLTYTPAANANGSATVSIRLKDDGGTANGGVDVSPSQTFTITVVPVNDAPAFTRGANQTALEDAGPVTVAGWATGISAGAPDEAGQALSFEIASNTNPALFAAGPAVNAATGTLTYTPAPDANGSATVQVRLKDDGGTANGGVDASATQSFTITVTPVNDAPGFAKGPDQTVLEDAGAQTVAGWATGISAGPADESGQALTFEVTGNSNPGLFAVLPSVSPAGVLTYTPAPNAYGSAAVTVRLKDNGGTANGGVDASPGQTFTITLTPVNDPPSFTKGANKTVVEDAGAVTFAGWATSISAGPPSEAGQALSFEILSNTNPGLFATLPAVSPAGVLAFTPAPDASGSATVSVRLRDDGGTANGGADVSRAQSFTITVTPVNDAPSFAKGGDQSVLEDAGAQAVSGWATGISPGPADESGQTLTFQVTTDNDALFSALPAVHPVTGALTYTPAANANGSAVVTVRLKDNGGVLNGGADTSAPQTFTITVTPVNDAPSFTKGPDVTVAEDPGPQTRVGWATDLSKGPANESAQGLTFEVLSNTNPGLFADPPAVSPAGTLTFTPAADANGSATITLRVRDDGGTADGGVDASAPQTFTITVTRANDPPVAVPDAASTTDRAPVTADVLANDTDPDGDPLTLVSVTGATKGTATVVNDQVRYTPRTNAHGDDVLTYTVRDPFGATATGTLTVHVTDVTAPTVKEVRLYYGTGRYEVLTDRLPVLAWSNVRRVQLVFSENVSVQQGDLRLTGVNVANYAFGAFAYSATTFTATWTLSAPIGIDRLRLALDGTTATGVKDATAGNLIGRDVVRLLAVLPGDLDGDGVVTLAEAATVKKSIGKRYPNPRNADLNGDGIVTLADYRIVKANVGRRI